MSKISSKVVLKTFFNKNDSTIINGKEEIDELLELGIEAFRVFFYLIIDIIYIYVALYQKFIWNKFEFRYAKNIYDFQRKRNFTKNPHI